MAPAIESYFQRFNRHSVPFSRLVSFAAITCAIVDVVPEPVTPGSVWNRSPAANPSMSFFIASGWEPAIYGV